MASSEVFNPRREGQGKGDIKWKAARSQGGDLRFWTYTSDSILAGGNSELDLTSTEDWDWDAVKIHQIIVKASASLDFDVELYPNDGFTANTFLYKNENNNLVMNDKPIEGLFYIDTDLSQEMHLKIINTDAVNASTFDVYIILSPIS
jgi:hypothetical protein